MSQVSASSETKWKKKSMISIRKLRQGVQKGHPCCLKATTAMIKGSLLKIRTSYFRVYSVKHYPGHQMITSGKS